MVICAPGVVGQPISWIYVVYWRYISITLRESAANETPSPSFIWSDCFFESGCGTHRGRVVKLQVRLGHFLVRMGRYAFHGPTSSPYCLAITRVIWAMCPRS